MEFGNAEVSTSQILAVCTGNVCRSPYIERVLGRRLMGTGFEVVSAGTAALEGSAIDDRVAQQIVAAGGRSDGFAARQLTPELLRAADLVLCATRDHRTAAVRLEPSVLQRTFALADFADLAVAFADPTPPIDHGKDAPSALRQLMTLVPRYRTRVTPRSADAATITDPFRRSDHFVSRMVREIDSMLGPVEALLRSATSQVE